MTRIAWKFSFTLCTSNDDSKFWEKYQFWLKNVSSFKKELIKKVQSFLMSNFGLNQEYKVVLHKTIKFGTLTQLTFLSWLEKCFEVTEIFQKFKCEGGWAKLLAKTLFAQTILDKIVGTK